MREPSVETAPDFRIAIIVANQDPACDQPRMKIFQRSLRRLYKIEVEVHEGKAQILKASGGVGKKARMKVDVPIL